MRALRIRRPACTFSIWLISDQSFLVPSKRFSLSRRIYLSPLVRVSTLRVLACIRTDDNALDPCYPDAHLDVLTICAGMLNRLDLPEKAHKCSRVLRGLLFEITNHAFLVARGFGSFKNGILEQ